MEYELAIPSSVRDITDPETGLKFSKKDISVISSKVNASSSLVKFGADIYEANIDNNLLFSVYEESGVSKGYISYEVLDDSVRVAEVYEESINKRESYIAYEALIESVYNISKSLGKKIVILNENGNELLDKFIKDSNQRKKEQKIEDKYWWKIK